MEGKNSTCREKSICKEEKQRLLGELRSKKIYNRRKKSEIHARI
jgi:hypothetical protein